MNRLAQPGARSLPYFLLCREMGARAVDGMVKGRILDLRWTDPVSRELTDPLRASMRVRESIRAQLGGRNAAAGSSGTAVNEPGLAMGAGAGSAMGAEGEADGEVGGVYGSEEDMVPMTDEEVLRAHERLMDGPPAQRTRCGGGRGGARAEVGTDLADHAGTPCARSCKSTTTTTMTTGPRRSTRLCLKSRSTD
ncbi:hypothetical protein NUW54_g12762 [Trametes sanguinea]|uniref:Uncharacterized protein n=1 Tax=Trametes sanguinea TaxID=158606 RepID=A0ACC1MUC9_9APHY|nr:hypothetical protein NUW54_g12762 [Trametes sanguinea]